MAIANSIPASINDIVVVLSGRVAAMRRPWRLMPCADSGRLSWFGCWLRSCTSYLAHVVGQPAVVAVPALAHTHHAPATLDRKSAATKRAAFAAAARSL